MTGDILNSIKATLYDRISNPLIGAFFASWFIWNYKFVWVLFSASSFPEKFKHIDKILYPTDFLMFWHFVIMPACFAYLYLYWLPKLSHMVYRHHQTKQKELKKIRQEIEDETPLTQEEYRKIRFNVRVLESKHQQEMDELIAKHKATDDAFNDLVSANEKSAAEISDLTAKLNNSGTEVSKLLEKVDAYDKKLVDDQTEIDRLTAELKKSKKPKTTASVVRSGGVTVSELSDSEEEMIKKIAKYDGKIRSFKLTELINVPIVKIDVLLADLEEKKYVDLKKYQNGDMDVELTTLAKRYAVNKGYVD